MDAVAEPVVGRDVTDVDHHELAATGFSDRALAVEDEVRLPDGCIPPGVLGLR